MRPTLDFDLGLPEGIPYSRLPLVCCLVAFILTFFVTRTFVRMIRHRRNAGRAAKWWQPRNIYIGSTHIHHVAFGVVMVMISGIAMVTISVGGQESQYTLAATVFGIGAALVLDEFALILHLSDVYWSEQGRVSVEVVSLAVGCMGLALVGFSPNLFTGLTENDIWKN